MTSAPPDVPGPRRDRAARAPAVADRLRRMAPAVAVPLLGACSSFGAPRGATAQGQETNRLWRVFFVASLVVAAVVYGLIVWSVVRYRRPRGDDGRLPAQFRANLPLEVVYTAIPVLIVAVLFALTFRTERRVLNVSADPVATIRAEAFAWGWRFTYVGHDVTVATLPGEPPPEVVVPVGRAVHVQLSSTDVIHAFYVPDFLFIRDAIPGRITEFDFTPSRTGVFRGKCAEFCGLNHAFMEFTVRVVAPNEFTAWLDERSARGTPG